MSKRTLWQKETQAADWVMRFTVGEDWRWDTLLLPFDIEGTRAHAWGLIGADVLSEEEYAQVGGELDRLAEAVAAGEVAVAPEDEDSHTVIERHLTEELGDLGKKIHTGRSRNDQVLVAIRLFLRAHLQALGRQTIRLAEVLCRHGEAYDDALMPGYTHLQQAMPTTAGLWALGYAELLASDLDALRAAHEAVNVSPLGSAAGYGVPHLELPREAVARRLGFRAVQTHVTAVQLSRGKLELHAAHALVQVAATINRLASDLVLFSTAEFGFVTLPDAYCTGSSIMPQKKNPDVLELARASYHRLIAEMQVLLTLPANLPSGYHRDLQLTKAATLRGVLLARDLLEAMLNVLPDVRFERERMAAACTPGLFATADALARVREGVPFRDAYRQAAEAASDLAPSNNAQAALQPYRGAGYPGNGRPEVVRAALAPHRAWADPGNR